MSVTEPYFVRIDSEVARLAKATAAQRKMPLREVTERALRLFITEVTEPEQRASALHAMEEALLGRMDRRLGQHYERVAGLYARQAFDTAQALDLAKHILWYSVRDKETYSKILTDSRKEATRVLQVRAETPLPGTAAEEAVKKAQETVQKQKEEITHLKQGITKLEQVNEAQAARAQQVEDDAYRLEKELRRVQAQAVRVEARYAWAIQQFEAQRGFSKRPIGEFLRLWDEQNGRP